MKVVLSRFFALFGFSFITTLVLVAIVAGTLGVSALLPMLTLVALEITFSLDNAVVNAQVLQHMSDFWQRMFMTVGIIIAVFGMRLVLPIVVVGISANIDLGHVISIALHDPKQYAADLNAAHPIIAGFGGMFLLMIFLEYVFTDWPPLANVLKKVHGVQRPLAIMVGALALLAVFINVTPTQQRSVAIAGICGVASFLVVRLLSDWALHRHIAAGTMAKGGIIMFLYLEMLDASFSFDGVIGAFAITSNVILIAAGLGAGAVWVRSITISLVHHGTLQRYPYLELGAHLAIASLATILLTSIVIDVPDLLSGTLGLFIIVSSFLASVWQNRRTAKAAA